MQQRWKEHFVEVVNGLDLDHMADISTDIEVMGEIDVGHISKEEIKWKY